MKRIVFIFLHLLSAVAIAQEESVLIVESDTAIYEGKQITLKGNALLDHPLGKICAQHIEAIAEKEGRQLDLQQLKMRDRVRIELRDTGRLTCGQAHIDHAAMTGDFSGSEEEEYVVYTEEKGAQSGSGSPLTVKSRHMVLHINKEAAGHVLRERISAIDADRDVTVNYNNDYVAKADIAVYRKEDNSLDTPQSGLFGQISLHAKEKDGLCQISNRQGDVIKATQIDIDTRKHLLSFSHPRGSLKVENKKLVQEIDFSSDTLLWDDIQHLLTLRGDIKIAQAGMGHLTTDKELLVFHENQNGVKQVHTIECTGETTLVYTDQENGTEHILTCYGKVIVDHKLFKTTMESPRDINGIVLSDKKVFFKDAMGEIFADKLTIFYDVANHKLEPSRLLLEGDVRILKCTATDPENEGTFLQYAIADKVEYTAQAKEVVLSTEKPKRVLFFDKVNYVSMSAASLKIRRDELTQKESIQGVGDVRFSFAQKELEEFKKIFPLLK